MDKNEILNSHWYVRCFAAGNPNTPVNMLIELEKDSDRHVRRSAACNPKFKEVFNR
ncbi:HEAT repeat domain-containing protein [Barnesiella intestinihominis]|uniref:HEAT repeat domain-containing protein n=1 Tax=Barnesiella intestinihominis TaxID=487174 RepID=UPI00396746B1